MKIGRNDPCPCGSGRKYKNCCLEDQGSGLPDEGPAGVFAEIRQALQGRQFSSLEEGRAFPGVLSEVASTPYVTPEQTVRSCYSHRTLVNFAAFLGLAEVEPTTKEPYDRLYRVRKRPLLAEAVRFHIPG